MGVTLVLIAPDPPALRAAVVATCRDADVVTRDLVDKSVLVGDPARPVALEPVLERFRLADALVAVALDVFDQFVDPAEDLAVLRSPPEVRRARARRG
jgi:hypothetical protein